MVTTDTALALLTPNAVAALESACDDADRLSLELEDFAIASKADEASLNEFLGQIKVAIGNIEHARTGQVKPLNDQVKSINDAFRRPREVLEKLEASAKRKLTIWLQAERERIAREQAEARRQQEEAARRAAEAERQKQEALARAEAAKNSKAREKALADAKAAAEREATESKALVQARIAEPMEAPRGIKTDTATTGLVERWTFRVVDESKVPREFLVVSDQKVRQAIATGVRGIEGLEIYSEETLSTRIRQS